MQTTNYHQAIATQLKLQPAQVQAAIELFDGGNTLPFIARYRKERTGGLDEEQLRQVSALLASLRALDERRQTITTAIAEQGKLTDQLQAQLLAADTLLALEDLYQPFKQKRRTRASIARERGLQGLADLIMQQPRVGQTAAQLAAPFVQADVPSVDEALAGARDIVAETISDQAEVRRVVREKALGWGVLRCERNPKTEDARGVYQTYYAFELRIQRLRPHQVLAINRGEAEQVLRVHVAVPQRDWEEAITHHFRVDRRSPLADQLTLAIPDAAERLLLPAIERDVRRTLSEQAEAHAMTVFATNLQALLLQPPVANLPIVGIDPGFRTGCKVAVVDATGKVLETTTIYPHAPQNHWAAALETLITLIKRHQAALIAIGNGTASRETEQLAAAVIRKTSGVRYLLVNEAGASVYSASPLARQELPTLDVSLRGAVSIARRVQDPLAELVKIDPQSIGVGLYQHDVDQARLSVTLGDVVESVVNRVGVNLNTASPALLRYVAGIGPKLAEQIVAYRTANGMFRNRVSLKKVTGLGPKAFEQAAGFLRIAGGDNPLDASAIHPESYDAASALLTQAGATMQMPLERRETSLAAIRSQVPLASLAAELGTGAPTLLDIFEQLVRPGRDPRVDLPAPLLRSDVLAMDDLQPGLVLKGTVRNVVDFGVFVDIGVKQDGLLHRSQLPPGQVLQVGDVIDVVVQNVDAERGRIALGWPA